MRLLLLAICFAACTASPSPPKSDDTRVAGGEPSLPKFDDTRVAGDELVLAKIDADRLPMVAANLLAELERERLAPALVQVLEAAAKIDPVARSQGIASGLDSLAARVGWAQICRSSFAAAMAEYAQLGPAEGTRRVIANCDLERTGLLPGGPAGADKVDGLALIIAIVTYGALERGGPLHPFERKLLAALAAPAPGPTDREPEAP